MGKRKKAKKQQAKARSFEAAQASPQHYARPPNSLQSPDSAVEVAGYNLRAWGRYLDENHDIAIGVIDDLVTNIVGGSGITVEPTPTVAGRQNVELSARILELWDDWGDTPEVTNDVPWGELQRQACRAWLRDGECFGQHVGAMAPYPWSGTEIRYRLEFLEADMVPMDAIADTGRSRQGIIHDDWGRPLAYLVYLQNPYDYTFVGTLGGSASFETKTVPVERMLHLKFARRMAQTRGIPICHGIIRRLQDLKDYEDSERIAARVAASMCAFIRKSPDAELPQDVRDNVSGERERRFQAGRIFADLLPGEDVGTIDTNRPSSELANFRASQIRAISSGTGAKYSSVSRDYTGGSYSSQRQELVEAKPHYDRLRNLFVARFVRPIYDRWLRTAWLQGLLGVPSSVAFDDLRRAEFIGPGMPWIDPMKEVQADILAIENNLIARQQVIRGRGNDPRKVDALNAGDANRPTQLALIENEDDDEAVNAGA